jgi:hypothetical protein
VKAIGIGGILFQFWPFRPVAERVVFQVPAVVLSSCRFRSPIFSRESVGPPSCSRRSHGATC